MKWIGILLVVITLSGYGQNYTTFKFDRHISSYKSVYYNGFSVKIDSLATGIVLGIDPADNFEGSFLVIHADTIYLNGDEDNEGDEDQNYSNLISFSSQVDSLLFFPSDIKKEVTFFLIDSRNKTLVQEEPKTKKKSVVCSAPEMIEQSEWRQGLPDPDYDRINQEVNHVIIHHTAGSNSDTNYTEVVRNIYVFHTQIRGWSDIGYNYLIAQNGTVFKGRDPGVYEQDNVMGAHFCNSNSGTMGISMMGTYTDIVPTETALQSLVALINWKLGKDHLNPLGNYYHLLNPELSVIAGHRDGCATECPGNSMYALLDTIRNEVMTVFNECNFVVGSRSPISVDAPGLVINYKNFQVELNSGLSTIEFVRIIDLMGRPVSVKYNQTGTGEMIINLDKRAEGIMILICKTINGYHSEKLLLTK